MIRQPTKHEAGALHLMCTAKYRAGESPEDIEGNAADYLGMRGWDARDAFRRGCEAVRLAIADVDGLCGVEPLPGG